MKSATLFLQPSVVDDGVQPLRIDQTLLCSDVVGFTRLTESLGDWRAWSSMERMNRRIRRAAGQYGGIERELRGDGFLFTFPHPHAALMAAIVIQREQREVRGAADDDAASLRIALHCGPVFVGPDRLFGQQLILAFRLAEYARGDQILVSEVARQRLAGAWQGRYSRRVTVQPAGFSTKVTYSTVMWEAEPPAALVPTPPIARIHSPVRARLVRPFDERQIN